MDKKYYSLIKNADQKTADLYIFGDIVSAWSTAIDEAWNFNTGDASGLSVVKDISETDADQINVHINSMGGLTSEGLAIYSVLKNHPAKIVTMCDGFACSAASLVFMAGDERVMSDASLLMIHNAWMNASGNAHQLRATADELEKISTAAANAYASKVTICREELDALLDGAEHDGTWISPEEAVEMGFATKITASEEDGSIKQSAMYSIQRKLMSKSETKVQPEMSLEEIITKAVEKTLSAVQPSQIVTENHLPYAAEPETDEKRVKKTLADTLFSMKK